jgi:hypothetical protein
VEIAMEWTPRHKTTARTESLVQKLGELACEVDDSLLQAASVDARSEWNVLCETWPSAGEVRAGVIGLSDDDLDAMIAKVFRFKAILTGLKRRAAVPAPAVAATFAGASSNGLTNVRPASLARSSQRGAA